MMKGENKGGVDGVGMDLLLDMPEGMTEKWPEVFNDSLSEWMCPGSC